MAKTKEQFTAEVNAMRDRWAKEAKDCIEKHGLVVYGDELAVA